MESVVMQMHLFFDPRSVAVIGASRKITKAGHIIFKNFVDNKRRGIFKGELYPVNHHEQTILGYKCYPSLTEIDEEIELIVIVVPAKVVPETMKEAATKGVKSAVIISAGFGEIGNRRCGGPSTNVTPSGQMASHPHSEGRRHGKAG